MEFPEMKSRIFSLSRIMKVKTLAWFEGEVEQLVASLQQYRKDAGQKQQQQLLLSEEDLQAWSPTFRQLIANLRSSNSQKSTKWTLKRLSTFLFLFIIALPFLVVTSISGKAATRWFSTTDPNCLLGLPDSLQNAFVPPNGCDFCRNLTTIARRQQLSPEEFTEKYAYSKVPVVVTDALVNWSAPAVFSFDYFRRVYLGTTGEEGESDNNFRRQGATRTSCQFFPYRTEFRSLEEALRMAPERAHYNGSSSSSQTAAPWYIGWSNCDYRIGGELRRHYARPYFLPLDAEALRTDWIFMGTPNNGAHMHIDHVGRPSWQAQIRGQKRWFLEPPLECYGQCADHQVDVEEGQIIVLDTNVWYHRTLILGHHVSITIGAEYD